VAGNIFGTVVNEVQIENIFGVNQEGLKLQTELKDLQAQTFTI
jgi:hypothetical protein